jgi:hypothetical protein
MILSEALEITGTAVYEWLDHEAEVPVVDTAACQGDISILRVTVNDATTALPRAGVVLVRSEATSHTHTLHGDGCFYDPATRDGLDLGRLTVPEGREALISHQEHGALLVQPGTYRICRQREYAGEWAYVAD